jgi:N-terminal domain of reverse transcriptase
VPHAATTSPCSGGGESGPESEGTTGRSSRLGCIYRPVHEDNVGRRRPRIFRAAQECDLAEARRLQNLMLRSWSNTATTVRQAT